MSNAIVKNLNFGSDAKDNVFAGITKLTQAVSSTLGAGGKCVILEDNTGKPLITKDGVTVAEAKRRGDSSKCYYTSGSCRKYGGNIT